MPDVLITVALAGLTQALSGFTQIEQQVQGTAQRIDAAGQSLQRFGGALSLAVSVPLATVGTAVVGFGSDFQKAMNDVEAAMQGIRPDQLNALSEAAIKVGRDTNFGASDAARGIEMLAKNGVDAEQILGGALQATVAMASAAGTQLAPAADLATDAMANFNIPARDLPKIVDQLAGSMNESKLGFDDYRLAMGQAGGVAGQVGVSFNDFTTAIALTAPAFDKGSDAGTGFKTFLQRLVPDTKPAREAMEQLGLYTEETGSAFFDAQGNMRPMNEIAGLLAGSFGRLNDEQKIQAATTIFSTDAMRTALSMAKAGTTGFDDLAAAIGRVSAQEMAEARMRGLSGAMEALRGSLETLSIRIFNSGLGEFLEQVVRGADAVVDQLAALNPSVLNAGVAFGAAAVALGPLAVGLGTLLRFVVPLTSPLTMLVAGVVALITAFDGWGRVGEVLRDIGAQAANLSAFVAEVAGAFRNNGIEAAIATFVQGFANLGSRVAAALAGLGADIVSAVTGQISGTESSVTDTAARIGTWIGTAIGRGITALATLGASIVAAVADAITPIEGGIGSTAQRVGAWIAEAIPVGITALSALGGAIVDAVSAEIGPIQPRIAAVAQDIGTWIGDAIPAGLRAVVGFAEALRAWVVDELTAMLPQSAAAGEGIGRAIGEGVIAAIDGLASIAADVVAWLLRSVSGGDFTSGMRGVLEIVALGFANLAEFVRGVLVGFGGALLAIISDQISGISAQVEQAIQDHIVAPFGRLGGLIEAAWSSVRETVVRLIDDYIVTPFRDLEDKLRAVLPASIADRIFGPEVAARVGANAQAAADEIVPPIERAAEDVSRVGESIGTNLVGPEVQAEVRQRMEGVASAVTMTAEQMNVDVSRLQDETVDIYGEGFRAVEDEALRFQDEMVGNSIIPDTVNLILSEWQKLGGLSNLTTDALRPVIEAFGDLEVSLETTFPADFAANIDEATFAFGRQNAELGNLSLTIDGTVRGITAVGEAHAATETRARTAIDGMRAGWDGYFRDVNDFARTWEDTTRQGLETIQSTISNFVQTGKLDFDDLKNFAIQSFGDIVAQGVMAFSQQGFEAIRNFALGTTTELTTTTTTGTSLFQTMATNVGTTFAGLGTTISGWATTVQGYMTTLGAAITETWRLFSAAVGEIFTVLQTTISGWMTTVQGLFTSLLGTLTTAWTTFAGTLTEIFGGLLTTVQGWIASATELFSGLMSTLTEMWTNLSTTIQGIFTTLQETLGGWINTALELFGGFFENLTTGWNTLLTTVSGIFDDLSGLVSDWYDIASELFGSFFEAVSSGFTELLAAGGRMFSGLSGGWGGVIGDFIGGLGSLGGAAVSSIGGVGAAVGGITDLVTDFFAEGGIVEGQPNWRPRGTDTVPAMLTPGEFVVNARSSERYGNVLEQINAGTFEYEGLPSGYGHEAAAELFGSILGGMLGGVAAQVAGPWGSAVAGFGPKAGAALARNGYTEWENANIGSQRVLDQMNLMNLDELSRKSAQAGMVDQAAKARAEYDALKDTVGRVDFAAKATGFAMSLVGFLAGTLLGPPGALAVGFATPFAKEVAARMARAWDEIWSNIKNLLGLADKEIAIRSGLGGLDSDGNFTPGPGGFPNEFPDFGGNPGIGGDFDPGGFGGGGGGSFDPGGFGDTSFFSAGGPVRGFATGGDAVFSTPTLIQVAEQGPEFVRARPLGQAGAGMGRDGQTIVFQGPVIASDLSMGQLARRMMREIKRETARLS